MEEGYGIHLKEKGLYLRDCKGKFIANVTLTKGKMFLLNIKIDVVKCLKASVKDSSWLWHLRSGPLTSVN